MNSKTIQGKIIRGVGGFYYIHTPGIGVLECKAKGIFRNQNIKPLVGDDVMVEILDLVHMLGNIQSILPRRNSLIRPAVANVDQAAVVFAASYPKPNLNLLDRFLLMMETQRVPTLICFNKSDDVALKEMEELTSHYVNSGSLVITTSSITGQGLEQFRQALLGKTTVLAGPSGVGKSSVMNGLFPEAKMEIGAISEKIKRGKHTTRHSELFCLEENTYIMDTPGFTSLSLPEIEKEDLRDYFQEFDLYRNSCRFQGCTHLSEPNCLVKVALEDGKISSSRYDNYKQFFEEISNHKKY